MNKQEALERIKDIQCEERKLFEQLKRKYGND